MRLLLVVAELRHGGAERIVVELAADAGRRGDVVMVASSGARRWSRSPRHGGSPR